MDTPPPALAGAGGRSGHRSSPPGRSRGGRERAGSAAALLGTTDAGELGVGAAADLVVVEGDPLADIRVLQRPVLVVKGGRTVR